jgi:predicted HAD superfamily Cof-like phosphohydrolase
VDRQLRQLQAFHQRFGAHMEQAPTADIPAAVGEVRAHLIAEELAEYRAAFAAGDLVEIADALTDLLYLVLGTYHSHGLQDIAAELFDEVHRSNMTKLGANGQPVLREDGKVLKSELYSPPDLRAIVKGATAT